MFGTSGSWLCQPHSNLESSAVGNCTIASTETRQHEFLPASANPCRISANLSFNEFGLFGWPGRGLMSSGNGLSGNSVPYFPVSLVQSSRPKEHISLLPPRGGEKPWITEAPDFQQRKFLVFDQSGNETRLMFTSACPRVQTLQAAQNGSHFWNPQGASSQPFDDSKFIAEREAWGVEQACTKTPIRCEESGENEILCQESEMHEDTEEINALLYSDDDDVDSDNGCGEEDEGEDEVSSGHSPSPRVGVWQSQEEAQEPDFDSVGSSSTSLKRRKVLDGGYTKPALKGTAATGMQIQFFEKIDHEDVICALDDEVAPNVGNKRSRKNKIHDTLKVLKSIMPGVKNKDPVAILDEAISYLKSLKYNAELISAEDSDTSGCYEPLN